MFRGYIKVMEQFYGDEEKPEVQQAHQAFRDAEKTYLAAMTELSQAMQKAEKKQ
jgi:hypothetical protein